MGTQDVTKHVGEARTQKVRDSGISLHNRLDQLRGYPRVCFASHKIIHLGLSDFPLAFREPQPVSWYRKDVSLLKPKL